MPRFVKLALRQEGLSRKAKEEPKFKFHDLYGQVLLVDTLRCAWEQARANKGAAGVDHVAFEDVERSEGGVEGFLTSYLRYGPSKQSIKKVCAKIKGQTHSGG